MNTTTHARTSASSKLPTATMTSSLALGVIAAALSIAATPSDDADGRGNPTQLPDGSSPVGTVYDCSSAPPDASVHANDAATIGLIERTKEYCERNYCNG